MTVSTPRPDFFGSVNIGFIFEGKFSTL